MEKSKFSIQDAQGRNQEILLDVTAYKAAADAGMSLSEYVNAKYPTAIGEAPAFEQMMASSGMFLRDGVGVRSPTIGQIMTGQIEFQAGDITRPDGSGTTTPSSRLLFPEVILQIIKSELETDYADYLGGYNNLIANTQSIASARYDRPIINTTAARDTAAQPIAQLAEPAALVTITLSEESRRITTKAIGLTISDEAMQAATIDLVGTVMTAQARQERVRVVDEQLNAMLNGDSDYGESALSSVQADSFDPLIVAAGVITQKAWVNYLRANYRKMSVTDILMDINTALAVEARTNKPTISSDDPESPRLDTTFSTSNLGIIKPNVFLLDTATIGANTLVGLDRRYAIQRVINVAAAYEAIEQYVMRRATSFRVDFGEIAHKLMTDAWTKMTLTV